EPYKRKLVTTVVSSNGKPDCQDELTPVGKVWENYVLFRNGGGLALCSRPDVGMSCYANLQEYALAPARPKLPEKTAEQLESERLVRVFAISRHQCSGGDAEACYTVGNYRYNGTVGPVDLPLARADFESACDLGSANGCVSLGAMMHAGTGGDKQPREARRLLKRYCTEEQVSGCWNYGAMQFEGAGGRKDLKGARVSFERACKVDEKKACQALGVMNTNGLGGPVNVEAGRTLLAKACDLGGEKACEDVTALDEQAATMAWQAGE
ncbi:MAG: tetratricopeptide repeat protein, partial [Henriciella sp.]